jgi:hypothetical protein
MGEASLGWSGALGASVPNVGAGYIRGYAGETDQFISIGTGIPDGVGGFTGFRGVAAGSPNLGGFDTQVVFLGMGSGGQEGIYYYGSPTGLKRLIAKGDALDGRIVQSLEIDRDAEFGLQVAFYARFTDGSQGIYYTNLVPEPSSAALVAAGVGVVLAQRRTRGHR